MKIHSTDVAIWIDKELYLYKDIAYFELASTKSKTFRLFTINLVKNNGEVIEISRADEKQKVLDRFDRIREHLVKRAEFEDLNSMLLNIYTPISMRLSVNELKKQSLCISFDQHQRLLYIKNRRRCQELLTLYNKCKSARVDEI